MNRSYDDWLDIATEYKENLDVATSSKNSKDILYFRGKYLFALKQAYKLNSSGVLSSDVTGYGYDVNLNDEIQTQLNNHRRQIEASLKENKKNSSIKSTTLVKELGLKIRRLSTRASQVNFATSTLQRQDAIKDTAKDSAGLVGTVLKAPVMVTAKVTSTVGPLAITICALPFKVFASLMSVTIDVYNGKVADSSSYNNTVVDQLSDILKDGIKKISKATYESVGRI